MYEYEALVTKVYDGDTITVDIDLGFGIFFSKQTIRLADINTPEVRGEEREQGLISRDVLREKILNKVVVLRTRKDSKGKYGRFIAEVIYENKSINNWLVENKYAEYVKY